AILCDRGADRRPVGLHRVRIGDLEFDDEIGGHGGLPWRSGSGLAAYEAHAAEPRSEEHTSELQSLTNLVCRLLLEKKKNNRHHHEAYDQDLEDIRSDARISSDADEVRARCAPFVVS